jgi:hypothetical protein
VRDRLDLREHRLLGEVALVDLADALLGPDDLVGEDGEREQDRREDDHEPGRQVRRDGIVRPALHVAEGPVRRRQPQDHPVDDRQLDAQLDDRIVEDGADGVADGGEDLVHSAGHASVMSASSRVAASIGGQCTTALPGSWVTLRTPRECRA